MAIAGSDASFICVTFTVKYGIQCLQEVIIYHLSTNDSQYVSIFNAFKLHCDFTIKSITVFICYYFPCNH